MTNRIHTPELIDLGPPHYTQEEYSDCLHQLGRIGKYLGGNRATLWGFNTLSKSPQSILDVGCGGGQFTIQLAKYYPNARVKGIDISADAIQFAQQKLSQEPLPLPNITFTIPSTPELNEPDKSYDVVTATLVCHHLSDEAIIQFLKKSTLVAKQAVIINDLHRHPLARLSFSLISPLCFPNRLIAHDGLLSIQRAFTKKNWISYLQQADIPSHAYSLTWHWAFRWILIIYPGKI